MRTTTQADNPGMADGTTARRPASGNHKSLRERVTLVSPAEQTKRFCEGAAWVVAVGRRVFYNRSRSQARTRRNRPAHTRGRPRKAPDQVKE